MVTPSLAANLIGNMVQATVELGKVWDSCSEDRIGEYLEGWERLIEEHSGEDKQVVAEMIINLLLKCPDFNSAWSSIDPEIRGKQIGLIGEVVGNAHD